jgi:phospholipase/carboxylesterase
MNDLRIQETTPQAPQRGSVIWMHGLGASNHDFDDVVPLLELPDVRFVFPAAPEQPVTINGGMVMPSWYDILSFQDPPLREDEASVRSSAKLVSAVIQREIDRGVPAERIVLMGFSQGGAMALHVGLRFTERLAGIAVLSGYLLLPRGLETERQQANSQTPILFCHGKFDQVVPLPLGQAGFEAVKSVGVPSEFHSFAMEHSLCMPEVQVLKTWLQERFA